MRDISNLEIHDQVCKPVHVVKVTEVLHTYLVILFKGLIDILACLIVQLYYIVAE